MMRILFRIDIFSIGFAFIDYVIYYSRIRIVVSQRGQSLKERSDAIV